MKRFASINDTANEFIVELYLRLDRTVSDLGCTCSNCKACCDFGRAGHRLFVTNLELEYFVAKVPEVKRPCGSVCPYLDPSTGCTVRQIRPVGCRTFFCKPPEGYDPHSVTEQALREIKSFVDREKTPYQYCEWLGALDQLV
jgi:hypothetical protein